MFYNGEKGGSEEQILRLSDAFENKEKEFDVELKVRMFNINYGHNRELMEKCRVLEEYAEFVSLTRRYISEGQKTQDALNTAINYCIDHGILSSFLRKYRAEVLGMLLEEFDKDKYERSLKNEGIQQGTERINRLHGFLLEQNRIADLKRAIQDAEYREQLFREFDL